MGMYRSNIVNQRAGALAAGTLVYARVALDGEWGPDAIHTYAHSLALDATHPVHQAIVAALDAYDETRQPARTEGV